VYFVTLTGETRLVPVGINDFDESGEFAFAPNVPSGTQGCATAGGAASENPQQRKCNRKDNQQASSR
jgi:hypothetical protein